MVTSVSSGSPKPLSSPTDENRLLRVCSAEEFVPRELDARMQQIQMRHLQVPENELSQARYWIKLFSTPHSSASLKQFGEDFMKRFPSSFQGLRYEDESELKSLTKLVIHWAVQTSQFDEISSICAKFEGYFQRCHLKDVATLQMHLYLYAGNAYRRDDNRLHSAIACYDRAASISERYSRESSAAICRETSLAKARILWARGDELEVYSIVDKPIFLSGGHKEMWSFWLETALKRKLSPPEIRANLELSAKQLRERHPHGMLCAFDLWLDLCVPYLSQEDLEEQEAHLNRLLVDPRVCVRGSDFSNVIKSHLMMAKVWFLNGSLGRAATWLDRLDASVRLQSTKTSYVEQSEAMITYFRAAILTRQGDWINAKALLASLPQRTIREQFLILKHQVFLELIYAEDPQEGIQRAITLCEQARDANPLPHHERPRFTLLLVLLHLAANNFSAARALYNEEMKIFDKNPQIKLMGAILSVAQGRIEEAKGLLEEGIQLSSQCGDFFCLGVGIYKSLGDEEGLQQLKRKFFLYQPGYGFLWQEYFLVEKRRSHQCLQKMWEAIEASHAHTPLGGKPAWAPFFLYPVRSKTHVPRDQFYTDLISTDIGRYWLK